MARQYVFLVHGMGEMDPNLWHEPFTTAVIEALQQYGPFDKLSEDEIRAQHLKFIPITYDHILFGFHERWEKLCGDVEVADAVAAICPGAGEVFEALSESVGDMAGWKQFFWTHVLDPMLWYLYEDARMAVVSHVCKEFIKGIIEMHKEGPGSYAHVLAHSLGTSVTHDSLVALRHWNRDEGSFKPGVHVWQTVGMVANVSRLLETAFTLKQGVDVSAFEVYRSALKPGDAGSICKDYVNVRHEFDPFTWPYRFDPADWPHNAYSDVTTRRIGDIKEVHDFKCYFADPNVHVRLLRLLLMQPSGLCLDHEQEKAKNKYISDFPISTSTTFQDLKAIYGDDPDKKLTLRQLAIFLFKALKEL